MAKRNAVLIRENTTVALATLALGSAIKVDGAGIDIEEDFYATRVDFTCSILGLAATEGNGLMVGICSDELSVAEIAESISAGGPNNMNDRLLEERASRNVLIIGSYSLVDPTITEGMFTSKEGGPMMTVTRRWLWNNPEGWTFFIFNAGTTLTTGSSVRVLATHYGAWAV